MKLLEECLAYFDDPAFERFLGGWLEKYQKLGHLGGKLVLDHLNDDECHSLGLLLGMDLNNRTLSITYTQFVKKWQMTRYESLDFLDVLLRWAKAPVLTHREARDQRQMTIQNFCQEFLEAYKDTDCEMFLIDYFENELRLAAHILNEEGYEILLKNILNALNHLPEKDTLLSVFAWQITRDPHYFDHGSSLDLLLRGIAYMHQQSYDGSLENTYAILKAAHLLRDDLSNNVMVHLPMIGSLYITLYELKKVHFDHCKMNVFIVENPSVFRELLALDMPLICGNGQINMAAYYLLDQLNEAGCELYYAGDFDPEGLRIADRLKMRYPNLHLWLYEEAFFERYETKTNLDESRIAMLQGINDPTLKKIAAKIKERRSVIYQEGLLDFYMSSQADGNLV